MVEVHVSTTAVVYLVELENLEERMAVEESCYGCVEGEGPLSVCRRGNIHRDESSRTHLLRLPHGNE